MALHRRSPRALADALAPLQRDLTPQTLIAEIQGVWPAALAAAWPAGMGAGVARMARPVSVRAGTLTVRCSDAIWAQEIDLMSPDVLAKLNPLLKRGRITALRCVIR